MQEASHRRGLLHSIHCLHSLGPSLFFVGRSPANSTSSHAGVFCCLRGALLPPHRDLILDAGGTRVKLTFTNLRRALYQGTVDVVTCCADSAIRNFPDGKSRRACQSIPAASYSSFVTRSAIAMSCSHSAHMPSWSHSPSSPYWAMRALQALRRSLCSSSSLPSQ